MGLTDLEQIPFTRQDTKTNKSRNEEEPVKTKPLGTRPETVEEGAVHDITQNGGWRKSFEVCESLRHKEAQILLLKAGWGNGRDL